MLAILRPFSRLLRPHPACRLGRSLAGVPGPSVSDAPHSKVEDLSEDLSGGVLEGALLIDCRHEPELEEGTIPGSTFIPFPDFLDPEECPFLLADEEFLGRYGSRKPRPDEDVVFFCRSGHRSHVAAEIACAAGYRHAFNYRGGWTDWVARRSGS